MDLKMIAISIFLIIAIATNVATYIRLVKRTDETADEAKLRAYFMLIDRKLDEVKENMNILTEKIDELKLSGSPETDELAMYVKNNTSVKEIAKKMNKSVKEVELMIKMRGLS